MERGINQRVRSMLKQKGISITALSKVINIPQATLNRQISGESSMTANVIESILTYFEDVSAEWLLRGKGKMLLDNNNLLSNAPEEPVNLYKQMRHDYNNALIDNLRDTYDKTILESSKQEGRQQKQIDSLQAHFEILLEITKKQMNG